MGEKRRGWIEKKKNNLYREPLALAHTITYFIILMSFIIIIDDAFFQPELGWSVLGAVGPILDCWRAGLQALGVILLCKNKEEGGRRGLRLWPL